VDAFVFGHKPPDDESMAGFETPHFVKGRRRYNFRKKNILLSSLSRNEWVSSLPEDSSGAFMSIDKGSHNPPRNVYIFIIAREKDVLDRTEKKTFS
jgi:hypothetical protein